MSKKNLPVLILFVAVAGSAGVARADVIFNDFGTDPAFVPDSGVTVSNGSTDFRPSFQFTPSGNYVLSEIDFVTSIFPGSEVNQVTITLSSDNSGVPGTAIASQDFDNMGVLGTSSAELSWFPTSVDLTSGTPYWITFDAPDDSNVSWNYVPVATSGLLKYQDGEWVVPGDTELGAIEIQGDVETVAPEPAGWLTFGAGLLTIGMLARRRTWKQSY